MDNSLSLFTLISTVVAIHGKWGVWVDDRLNFFDSEEEARKFYETFPEEGEVPEDDYSYACLYNPSGICVTENT